MRRGAHADALDDLANPRAVVPITFLRLERTDSGGGRRMPVDCRSRAGWPGRRETIVKAVDPALEILTSRRRRKVGVEVVNRPCRLRVDRAEPFVQLVEVEIVIDRPDVWIEPIDLGVEPTVVVVRRRVHVGHAEDARVTALARYRSDA
ncbi:MAG TPA: hypothetical protein VI258_04815 [Rhodanobacteraceae bacterium]